MQLYNDNGTVTSSNFLSLHNLCPLSGNLDGCRMSIAYARGIGRRTHHHLWLSASPSSNAFYVEFPGEGHVVTQQPTGIASGYPAQIVRQFFDEPTHAPDVDCIRAHYQIPWLLPE